MNNATFCRHRKSWQARRHRKRWRIEDKLGELIAEITQRMQAERDRIAEQERARLQRQRNWEAAMANARARFQEDRRIDALTKQLKNWEKVISIRSYCETIEAEEATGQNADHAESQARWLEWCRAYADHIDPTKTGAAPPDEIEPSPSDLKPYLGQFSPYGP